MYEPGPASRIGHVGAPSAQRSAMRNVRSDSRPIKETLTRNCMAPGGRDEVSASNVVRGPRRRTAILW